MTRERYILDGHKALYHMDRIKTWLDGGRVPPISIDWAITQACPYNCIYCYAQLQKNPGKITRKSALDFLTDAADIGVLATTLTGDGESTFVPFYYDVVKHGKDMGLDMATSTCGYPLKEEKLPELLESLTYLRFNVSAGVADRYAYIHGVTESHYHKVCDIIRRCVELKRDNGFKTTIGLQMVLMPEFEDQIIPVTELGKKLGVDYTVIKHCSDDEEGQLKVDYQKYKDIYPLLKQAETYTDDSYLVKVKWSKIKTGRDRRYIQCLAAPFMVQVSGSGLVAPCGPLFHPQYKKYHIGNIVETRFKKLYESDRWWEVMKLLASDKFDARKDCSHLCLQDKVNEFLWSIKMGDIDIKNCTIPDDIPEHVNFL